MTPADTPASEHQTATILVVDDAAEARDVLSTLLKFEGFHTLEATNGRHALEVIDQQLPDMVIMDIMMPEMDGLETLQHIRERHDASALPVILVTALGSTQDVVTGFDLGANDYITKPPQFEILIARVRTQLRIKQLEVQRQADIIELRSLSALKEKFLRIAAHDLRNPLNNLVLGTEVLARSAEERGDDEALEVIETMRSAAEVMDRIINDFLDLGALEAGRLVLTLKALDLNEVVSAVAAQFAAAAEQRSVEVQKQLESEPCMVRGDYARLVQVTANLLSNAIKFSPEGGRVVLRTRREEGRVVLEVADNGPGIPEDELPMLFKEYARLRTQAPTGEKSSGLGLSIAKGLIDLHGGRIGCRSKLGVGSLFWFALPLNG